jgi:hypothetical protein
MSPLSPALSARDFGHVANSRFLDEIYCRGWDADRNCARFSPADSASPAVETRHAAKVKAVARFIGQLSISRAARAASLQLT